MVLCASRAGLISVQEQNKEIFIIREDHFSFFLVMYLSIAVVLATISGAYALRSPINMMAEKKVGGFFNFGAKAAPSAKTVVSEESKAAVALFKKLYSNVRKGGQYDLTEEELTKRFVALANLVKEDKVALQLVKNVPEALTVSSQRCADNFAVFEGKFGTEEAIGLITRNPLLLSVATTGYGSAEVAGKETIYLSYLINATRPVGKPLIFLLLLALTKPFIAPYLGF